MTDEKQKPKAITTNEVEAPRPEVRERKPALTTNTIQPQLPTRPEEGKRRPAKGPMITTGNIEEIRKQYVGTETKTEPAPMTEAEPEKKKGRAKKG
ncbi:MAG: hypothetical protein M0R06_13665 [Sphaerochaeta sp.]|jgi:hypothetical protein|nr:hypothetical protein [Dehalococcoidia bacterium]MCK9600087.1 hypothetical protein [Sphaerochaeta sp.]